MKKEEIEKIIEAGNHAPSGGNSQPWKFIVENSKLQVVALPGKDHRILNFRNRGTYIAHGALMENIYFASKNFGYEPKFELFPEENISTSITLDTLTETREMDLYEFIFQRHSNRKSFSTESFSKKEKEYLFQDAAKFPQCRISVVEGENIHHAAESLSLDTIVSLKNKLLHRLLFQEIIWTEEEQKKRPGLYIKTIEIAPPKTLIFGLLKHWRITKILNKIKLPSIIRKESIKTISSAGLLGAIIVDNNDKDFVYAGRLMENIWLRAAKLDLGFHLITGVVFYWQQINFGDKEPFSLEERNLINNAYGNLSKIFATNDKVIAVVFRIGKDAGVPSAVSYKRPPEIEWKNK